MVRRAGWSAGPAYWVESTEQVTGAEVLLVLHCRDAWWLLDRWRARRQFVWAAGTAAVSQIIEFVFARAGLGYGSLSASSLFSSLQPAFTIHPGESGTTAIRRLLAMVPDVIIMRGGAGRTRYPQPTDSVEYAYGGSGHAILAGRYHDLGASVNRVRAFGPGLVNEAFDFGEAEAVGERIEQVIDLNLTTAALAGSRADAELRAAQVRSRRDEIVAPVNCGQELYDVVSVTDPEASLDAAKRRVLAIAWRYSTGERPRYDITLRLGLV